jgi:hypothetical protein
LDLLQEQEKKTIAFLDSPSSGFPMVEKKWLAHPSKKDKLPSSQMDHTHGQSLVVHKNIICYYLWLFSCNQKAWRIFVCLSFWLGM